MLSNTKRKKLLHILKKLRYEPAAISEEIALQKVLMILGIEP